MGYAVGYGACLICNRLFGFNPLRVPSFTSPITKTREPICRDCLDDVNRRRVALGHEPFVPLPDAYEPVDDSELP